MRNNNYSLLDKIRNSAVAFMTGVVLLTAGLVTLMLVLDGKSEQTAKDKFEKTSYSLSAKGNSDGNSSYHGIINNGDGYSTFDKCQKTRVKNYLTCETTDGKFTILAVQSDRIANGVMWKMLDRVQVTNNHNHRTKMLKNIYESDGNNYYIPVD